MKLDFVVEQIKKIIFSFFLQSIRTLRTLEDTGSSNTRRLYHEGITRHFLQNKNQAEIQSYLSQYLG
jgi:hypothetical protein